MRVAHRIAESVPRDAFIVEIGGGTGALSVALADRARELTILEIDRGLAAVLRERFAPQPDPCGGRARSTVIEGDALEFDFHSAFAAHEPPRAICGNLPYNISTPLLERIVACVNVWESSVLMLQREYGKRLLARPGSSDYGSLSLFVRYFCRCEKLFDVGAAGFYPRPKVASTIVRLTPESKRARDAAVEPLLLWLIRAAFSQRRKMLVNSVAAACGDAAKRATIASAVRDAGIPDRARAETLDLGEFIRLAQALHAEGFSPPH